MPPQGVRLCTEQRYRRANVIQFRAFDTKEGCRG